MTRLEDKVAIITGGSGGIGKVVAKQFLQEGAKVTIVDIDKQALEETKSELEAFGDIIAVRANVANEEDVIHYVDQTIETFGAIDIFFNNAGIEGKVAPIPEISLSDFQQVLDVNVNGVFLGMKYVLPIMQKQERGSIINTSSTAGLHGSPGLLPYVTSKHAVIGMTKVAALEGAPKNVRVNSIHPSPVNTRMMRSLEAGFNVDDADAAKTMFEQGIPLGRYAESADISNLVLFLASDESTFITGSQYRVDGGTGAS